SEASFRKACRVDCRGRAEIGYNWPRAGRAPGVPQCLASDEGCKVSFYMARYATARYSVNESREARWARCVALFFINLMILTMLLPRFASLTTPAEMNLLAVSIGGLFIAIGIALFAIVRIWFGGQTGAAQSVAAIFIACLGLAAPLYYLSHAVTLPLMYD